MSGQISKGESIAVAPSGQQSSVLAIPREDQPCQQASAGQRLSLELIYSVKINAGDIIAAADARPEFSDQFEAIIHWRAEPSLLPGRTYLLQAIGGDSEASISRLKYRIESGPGGVANVSGFLWVTEDGIAIKFEGMTGSTKISMLLSNVVRGPVDPALFEVPSDYQIMELD